MTALALCSTCPFAASRAESETFGTCEKCPHRRRASLEWREKMLLGLAVAPASRLIDSAAVGNNGRKTIDTILGAWNRVSQNGQRPVLAENISYESYRKDGSKYTDEVKIDVGGKFQKLADLTDEGDRY